MGRPFKPRKPAASSGSAADIVQRIKQQREEERTEFDYRSLSLRIHGHICARCGREFSGKDLRLLTVHHKDGNHHNNPRDGSNWENLCVYCHEDIHSREILAGQIDTDGDTLTRSDSGDSEGMVSLADKLKAALEKK